MCGLVGIYQMHDHHAIDANLVGRMNDALFHRGPDEGGVHIEDGLALAHRRLSIIDRADGHQPLFNADRSVVVVYNGEIYNFRQLRAELEKDGLVFETHSDTEVIVHAWAKWGQDCVHQFRGMFAFALWDRNQRTLFIARDRLGIKPLYYSLLANGELIFASELKALKLHPEFDKSLSSKAIDEYFGFGYVPEPRSIYANTYKLPPGHTLLLHSSMHQLPSPQQYWDVDFTQSAISDVDAIESIQSKIRESVDIRLMAEVPLGSFLSGGVDSSTIVATMAGLSHDPVNTCSIGFGESDFDESSYAREVAQLYKTAHSQDQVDPDDYSLINKLAALYDEPFADSSSLPTYRVCELAKKYVTVVLSGDGGDEILAGYGRYQRHLDDLSKKAKLPTLVRSTLEHLGKIYPDSDWVPTKLRRRQGLLSLGQDPVTAFFEMNAVMKNDLRKHLYSGHFLSELQGYSADQVSHRHAANYRGESDDLAMAQYLDLKTYLPGDILTKVDRASMAHALEVRVPLLDHKLVEWSASLPLHMRRRNGEGKWLLKKSMEKYLPDNVLYRPKKGFAVPLSNWFRGPLRDQVEQVIQSDLLVDAGVFDQTALQKLWQRHQKGQGAFSAQIWSILMFHAFLKNEAD